MNIYGQWVTPEGKNIKVDRGLFLNCLLTQFLSTDPGIKADVDRAIQAARKAYDSWAMAAQAERAAIIQSIAAKKRTHKRNRANHLHGNENACQNAVVIGVKNMLLNLRQMCNCSGPNAGSKRSPSQTCCNY